MVLRHGRLQPTQTLLGQAYSRARKQMGGLQCSETSRSPPVERAHRYAWSSCVLSTCHFAVFFDSIVCFLLSCKSALSLLPDAICPERVYSGQALGQGRDVLSDAIFHRIMVPFRHQILKFYHVFPIVPVQVPA